MLACRRPWGRATMPGVAPKVLDHVVEPLAGHALAPLEPGGIHDEGRFVLACNAGARGKPAVDRLQGRARERARLLLRSALAQYPQAPARMVHILNVKPKNLAAAQAPDRTSAG